MDTQINFIGHAFVCQIILTSDSQSKIAACYNFVVVLDNYVINISKN